MKHAATIVSLALGFSLATCAVYSGLEERDGIKIALVLAWFGAAYKHVMWRKRALDLVEAMGRLLGGKKFHLRVDGERVEIFTTLGDGESVPECEHCEHCYDAGDVVDDQNPKDDRKSHVN